MDDLKRTTQQILLTMEIADSKTMLDRLLVPALVVIGSGYAALQLLEGDWAEFIFFVISIAALIVFAVSRPVQDKLLGQRFNRRHAAHTVLIWGYAVIFINLFRILQGAEPGGKNGTFFAAVLVTVLGVGVMLLRSLSIFTKPGYRLFATRIPMWEQFLLAFNEVIAVLLVAAFSAWHILRLLQPEDFTVSANPLYVLALGAGVMIYYVAMQFMWIQRANEWLSRNTVWVNLARLLTPFALLLISLVIANRLIARADPRTANLTGGAETSLAILAIAPVIWLIVFVVLILVYTGRRGLRQRFMPDALLDWLPPRVSTFLKSISDMDMLLISVALATSIPTYLLLVGGGSSQIIGFLRAQISIGFGSIVETDEQVLALLFAAPFYLLIIIILILYGYALSRPRLSARARDELVERLPIGFLIILVITLFLFAVPFSQVFTEGRLPRIPQDLGRILAFNVVIPLVMLYAHYFILIRIPYSRGQRRWREQEGERLSMQLLAVDRRLDDLNRQLHGLDRQWQDQRTGQGNFNLTGSFETLYRYMHINSMRDDINMQRLQIVTERQQLAEISEAPISLAVARLPIRIVSLGIPILLGIQIYQWAVVNNGLREIIENPNLTVFDFFRAILQQTQF